MKYISKFSYLIVVLFLFSNCGTPTCELSMPADKKLDSVNEQNIILDGHDVTAFFTSKQLLKGNPAFASKVDGITYQFASAASKQMFDANPAKYQPQFGGFCAVAASFNKVEPAQLDLFDVYEGKLYFARNPKAQKMWNGDKAGIKVRADGLWPCLVIGNGRKI